MHDTPGLQARCVCSQFSASTAALSQTKALTLAQPSSPPVHLTHSWSNVAARLHNTVPFYCRATETSLFPIPLCCYQALLVHLIRELHQQPWKCCYLWVTVNKERLHGGGVSLPHDLSDEWRLSGEAWHQCLESEPPQTNNE